MMESRFIKCVCVCVCAATEPEFHRRKENQTQKTEGTPGHFFPKKLEILHPIPTGVCEIFPFILRIIKLHVHRNGLVYPRSFSGFLFEATESNWHSVFCTFILLNVPLLMNTRKYK